MKADFHGTRFEGDGRVALVPVKGAPGTPGKTMSRASARKLIERMLLKGWSHHDAPSPDAWVALEYCDAKVLRHTVHYQVMGGAPAGMTIEIHPVPKRPRA